ncbi:MAG TPA: pyridoxal 5'-phosphate synthase glutaminase subunit PdxT [Acidimicrobiales bacterium]|nr:pyridoxal 5'-phosphate synthase glutaminase subunit PdxT [Acidimicrobiales bacterium]
MGTHVGVLALQGAVALHLAAFDALGVPAVTVRDADQLDGVDALVIPGGESTTMSMLLEHNGMVAPLRRRITDGMGVFGTCAGMILCARRVLDGRDDQVALGAIDLTVRRNAFGRQVDSFEADLDIIGLSDSFHAVFIRAPVAESVGEGVEQLATVNDEPVLCRQGRVLVSSFHPELTDDLRIHRFFLDLVA